MRRWMVIFESVGFKRLVASLANLEILPARQNKPLALLKTRERFDPAWSNLSLLTPGGVANPPGRKSVFGAGFSQGGRRTRAGLGLYNKK